MTHQDLAPPGFLWLTNLTTSEPVCVNIDAIHMVEKQGLKQGGAVTVHLDGGAKLDIVENLETVSRRLSDAR